MRCKTTQGRGGKESPPRLLKDDVPQPPHRLESAALISFLIHALSFSLGQRLSRCMWRGAHCHHRSPPHHPSVCLSTPAQSSLSGCREPPQGGVSTPTDQPEWGTTPECPPTSPSWLWVPPPAANIPIFCFSRGSLGFCGATWRGHTCTPPVLPPPGSLSLGAALVTRTRRSLLLLFRAIKR